MKKIIVWHNVQYDTYYYKIVKGYYADYFPGYKNQYNHVVILVIPLVSIPRKRSLLLSVITHSIEFLQKIQKNIERR